MTQRIALLLLGFIWVTVCSAKDQAPTAAPFTEGREYVTIAHPQRLSDSGKVEVVEVFSYGCPHCAHFAPYAEQLRKSLPAEVQFKLLPASFSPVWEPFARAYYAAKSLGVLQRTHLALFRQKYEMHYPISSLDELASFYARQDVQRAKFLQAARSVQTDHALARGNVLMRQWGVDATPTIVVDGKYRSNQINSYEQLLELSHWLVQRALKEQSDTAH